MEDGSSSGENEENAVDLWSRLICNPGHERIDRELVQLSMDERTKVFADVGGAQDINTEEPAFLRDCLRELEETLARMNDKPAFDLARRQSPAYTDNPAFRLMILRADNFEVEKSARRLIRHFETKLELFGSEKLARDITLAALNQDDLEALQAGGIQILPNPDQFQRKILFSRQVTWKYKSRENMVSSVTASRRQQSSSSWPLTSGVP